MNCEPNLSLPHYVDLNLLRAEELKQSSNANNEKPDQQVDDDEEKLLFEDEYDFFRICQSQYSHLSDVLSLKTNKYLEMKFDRFLNNWKKDWVQVRLYRDVISRNRVQKPRRMKLNGSFFDVDHKLAPAPYFPEPRQIKQSGKNK